MIKIKSLHEVQKMRTAGRIVAEVFEVIKPLIVPGITTRELDKIAAEHIKKSGAGCSFYNYGGFPGHVCISVNDEVIHGIPGKRKLCNGDVVSVDVGASIDGYHGDAARTFGVGEISPEAKKLIEVTEASFWRGMEFALPGNRLGDISANIQKVVESNGFSVVRDFVGHGIGNALHEEPEVPNYGTEGRGPRLISGMTIAIEPMVNIGTFEVNTLSDDWTVVTADGKLSAHYENTVLITKDGVEILTKC